MKLKPSLSHLGMVLAFFVFAGQAAHSLPADCGGPCGPDPGSPNYSSAVMARGRLLNARGYSSPLAAQTANSTIIGSQSYNYTIPVLHLPGRAGMDLVLNLYYNSRIWTVDTAANSVIFNADRDFPSYGFRLDFGYLEITGVGIIVTESDGTKRTLSESTDPNHPEMWYSTDGSHLQYNVLAKTLSYKNGTTFVYEAFPSNVSGAQSFRYRPIRTKDSNGNFITISYFSGFDQQISQVTDSVGRVINFNYDASNHLTSLTQALHPSGTRTFVTFQWTTKVLNYAFAPPLIDYSIGGSGIGLNGTTINILSGCTYPNGTGYRFTYGDWGIINEIETLSAAGVPRSFVSYNFPPVSQGALTDAPSYTQETISPDGGSGNTSVWTYAVTKNGTGVVTSMAVTAPNGTTTTTTLDPDTGLSSKIEVKDSAGTVQRTADYVWTTTGAPPVSTVLGSVTTTLSDTGIQSKIAYGYDPWANITDLSEYDFGLTLKRHTVTTYNTVGNYVTLHIVNLPSQILVKDGGENTITRTDLAYDGNTLTTVAGASGHDDVGYGANFTTRGNLTSVTRYANASAGTDSVARTFNYDTLGNVLVAQLDCCNLKTFNFSGATQYSAPDSTDRGPATGPQFRTSYTYNQDNGLVVASTDENGQQTQYHYDSMDRLTQTILPPQGATSVQVNTVYDDNATSPIVTNSTTANSGVQVTTMDGLGHILQSDMKNGTTLLSTVKYTYDKLWQRTQVSNPFAPGETPVYTNMSYDALGRTTRVTPPSSGFTQYDYSGNAVTITDAAGKKRKSFNDALGRLVEMDEPGEAFAGIAAQGSLAVNGTLRSAQTQPSVKATAQVSISGFNRSKTTIPQCPPPPMECDQIPETIYDSGNVFITVNGHEYDYFYPVNANGDTSGDVAAGLVNVIQADPARVVNASLNGSTVILTAVNAGSAGNNISFSTGSNYDTGDFIAPSFTPTPVSGLLAGGQDGITGATDAGTVSISVGGFTGTVCYGISSNAFCSGKPHYDDATAVASALAGTFGASGATVHGSSSSGTIQMTYNVVGMAGNTGATVTSTPDNASLFPGGSFSGLTTLSGGQDPAPAGLAHPFATTYTYDANNNLTLVSQAAGYVNGQLMPGQQRSYVYDSLGRVTSTTTPEAGTVLNFYTPLSGFVCNAGNPMLPCRIQDARGVVRNFSYDGINRPTGVQYTNTSGGADPANTPPVSYQYDSGGAAAFALDRLTKITEGSNSQTFTYDNLGRTKSISQLIDTQTYLIQYAYNLASQIISTTYPSGRIVLQNFDAVGRICSIGASASTCTTGTRYLTSPVYNAAGETTDLTLGNGVQAALRYNDHLQLSTLRYFKGATEILNLAYDYSTGVPGNNGQIQKVHYYTTPGVEDLTKSENFTYDSLGRLSAAQTGVVNNTAGAKTWSLTWTYDRLGNRLSQAMVGGDPTLPVNQPNFTIDPATNRIVGYCYDQAGNLLDDASCPAGSHKYFYDAANRLTKINTTAAVYTYFGASRIKKVVGSTTTRYIYAGGKPIAEYTGATPTLSTEYVYAGSQLLVTFTGTNPTYHHPDRLSNRAETNSSGTRGRTFGHLPYGEVWYETGTADKWKFTTYERDSATGETGLDYAQFRYYASPQGRFMGPDPLAGNRGAPQSLNGFAYAANDPVNAMDPKGLWCDGDGHGVCDPWAAHGGDMGFWDGIWLRDTVSLGEGYASTTWIFFPGVGNYDPRADFRDTAVKLSNDKTKTDCEKLARLIFKIGQISPDVGGGRANSGVGTLLGGLTEQNPYGGRNDSNYRVGVFHHDPYYASGFQDSGFLPQFQDQSNQVRHFVGWFGAGFYSPLGAGYARSRLYESEGTQDPSNPDVALGLAAIDMGSNFKGDYAKLAQDFWHKICGGNTDLKF